MVKLKTLFQLIIQVFFLAACSPEQTEQNLNESEYCLNEVSLFSIHDSLVEITIDFNLEPDSVLSSVQKKLDEDLCWKMVNFGLVLTDNAPVKVQLLKECDDGLIRCFTYFPEIKIQLNQRGNLMFDDKIIPIDSIKFLMNKRFSNNHKPVAEEILVEWMVETPKDSIEKAFENIIDGYLMNYTDLSKQIFSKNVCDLSLPQLDSLKTVLPFKIRLGIGRQFIPPPPSLELSREVLEEF